MVRKLQKVSESLKIAPAKCDVHDNEVEEGKENTVKVEVEVNDPF